MKMGTSIPNLATGSVARWGHGGMLAFPLAQWRWMLLASYVIVNVIWIAQKVVLGPDSGVDWQLFRLMPEAVANGTVYEVGDPGVAFVWSPVAAWLMAGAALASYWVWAAVHVAVVLLLRNVFLIALVLLSYAFWFDVAQGNTVTFVIVAGLLAMRGSRWGALAYFALLILMPRPLMLPLAGWLLWQDRWLWKPVAVLFAAHAVMVLVAGGLEGWVGNVLHHDLAPGITVGPTAIIGRWWLLAGVPLAALLAWRRRFGWAALAISPYVTPQYLLALVWEWGSADGVGTDRVGPRD